MSRRTHLNTIKINDAIFTHEIDLDIDSTFVCDEDGFVIFEVTYDGKLSDGSDIHLGNFHIGPDGFWYLNIGDDYHSFNRIVTEEKEIIDAERIIFEFLLKVKMS